MNAAEQMKLISNMMEQAKANGESLTIAQAQRKLHREYVTNQLWNKHGLRPTGFLVAAGFYEEDQDGNKTPDSKLLTTFNRYLNAENKLTGAQGVKLREAMDSFDIDYVDSPTWPLEPLKTSAA